MEREMFRSAALAAVLAAGLMAGGAAALDESEVIGTWQVDGAAYRQGLMAAVADYLAQMPEEMRNQLQEAMFGELEGEGMDEASAEFMPGGEMIFHATGEPSMPGTWRLTGDQIEFARQGREEDEPAYVGTVAGGVMRVVPTLDENDMPFEVPLTLHRR
jgi:hypothetical protein